LDIGLWSSNEPVDAVAAAWTYEAYKSLAVDAPPDPAIGSFVAGLAALFPGMEIRERVRPRSMSPDMPTGPVRVWVYERKFVLVEVWSDIGPLLDEMANLALTAGLVGYAPQFRLALGDEATWTQLRECWEEWSARQEALQTDEQSVPSTYDRLKWHTEAETFPPSAGPEQGFVHMGMYLTWIVVHDLHDPEGLPRKAVADIKARRVTACSLQKRLAGDLGRLRFSLVGARFSDFYYNGDEGYLADYSEIFGDAADNYAVPDSWESYARVEPVIARRYAAWLARGPTAS